MTSVYFVALAFHLILGGRRRICTLIGDSMLEAFHISIRWFSPIVRPYFGGVSRDRTYLPEGHGVTAR